MFFNWKDEVVVRLDGIAYIEMDNNGDYYIYFSDGAFKHVSKEIYEAIKAVLIRKNIVIHGSE